MPPRTDRIEPMAPSIADKGRFGKAGPFAALIALVGAVTAIIVVPETQKWEGREHVAYRDIAGILTICDGDTANVRAGQRASDAECDTRLAQQLVAHAKPVLRCVPALANPARQQQLAASVVLAYNIGPTSYCRSTAARRFNAGDWRGGCDAFLSWNKARVKGRLVAVRGLTNRRNAERKICLTGLS